MAYNKKILNHYETPSNVGSLDKKDPRTGTGIVGAPSCGDVMKLDIMVENDIIIDAKFKTFGCGSAIAVSSLVTEIVKDKNINDVLKITNKNIAEELQLPPIKTHCSVLAEEAIKSALNNYQKKQIKLKNTKKIDEK
ncbi:MAG: Fe-S cluster assembly scaffold IscU [Alphaproteobacteria bacterium]|nr:Fe-S cluster assembly scaffold IscU [Rickettsiales bacterium]